MDPTELTDIKKSLSVGSRFRYGFCVARVCARWVCEGP